MGIDEVAAFSKAVTKQRIASICLALGWNSVGTLSMEILQDLMIRYIRSLGASAREEAEHHNRTQPNVFDLQRVFDDIGVSVEDLEDYIDKMDDRAFKIGGNGNSENKDTCPEFPARSTSDLNFLSITSQEYRSRPAHIHEYMPPQYPEMETESGPQLGSDEPDAAATAGVPGIEDPQVKTEVGNEDAMDQSSQPIEATLKKERQEDNPPSTSQEYNPLKEPPDNAVVQSVLMTDQGFISPCRVGVQAASRSSGDLAQQHAEQVSRMKDSKSEPEDGEIEDDDDDDTTMPDSKHPERPAPNNKGGPQSGKNKPRRLPPAAATPRPRPPKKEKKGGSSSPPKRAKTPGSSHPTKPAHASMSDDDTSVSEGEMELGSEDEGDMPCRPPAGQTKKISEAISKTPARSNKPPKRSAAGSTTSYDEKSHSEDEKEGVATPIQKPAKPAATTPAAATLTPKASTSSVGAASSPVARGGPKGTRGGGTAGGPTKRKKKSDVARLKAAAAAAAEDSNRSTDTDNDGISWGAPIKRTATPTGGSDSRGSSPPPLPVRPSPPKPSPQPTPAPAPTLPAGPSEPSGASMGKNPLIPKGLYGFDLPPSISLTPVQRGGDKPEKSSSKKDKESKKDHHSKSDSGKKHDKPKKAKKDKKEKKSHKEKHRSSSPATKEAKKAEKAEKKKAKAEKKAKKDGKAPSFMEEPQLFAPTPSKKVERTSSPAPPPAPPPSAAPPPTTPAPATRPASTEPPAPLDTPMSVPKLKISLGDTPKETSSAKKHKSESKSKKTPAAAASGKTPATPSSSSSSSKKSSKKEVQASSTPSSKKASSKAAAMAEAASSRLHQAEVGMSSPASAASTAATSSPSTPVQFQGGGAITTQTVGRYVDKDGTEVWVCPACGKQDDGTPMIGCDACDDWYHWVCVNITQEPSEDQDWYCPRCRAKRSGTYLPPAATPKSTSKKKSAK